MSNYLLPCSAFELHLKTDAFAAADTDWHHELEVAFGRAAREARYELRGRGASGSVLRAAYDRRMAAMAVYRSAHEGWLQDQRAEARCDQSRATTERHRAHRVATIDRAAYAEEAL